MSEQPQTDSQEEAQQEPQAYQYKNMKFKDVPTKEDPRKPELKYAHSFHVEYTDPDTGTVHTGEFTCHRLTLANLTEHGVIMSSLCGGINIPPGMQRIASMIAYCEVALVKRPDWWNPRSMYDEEALHAMHDYVRVWEDSFRRKRVGERSIQPT